MRNVFLILLFSISFTVSIYASQSIQSGFDYVLQAPPKSNDSQSLYAYEYTLYQQWMTAQITTTNPNGNIDGGYGLTAVYYDGTNYWLMIQTTAPSGSTWVGIQLGAVP